MANHPNRSKRSPLIVASEKGFVLAADCFESRHSPSVHPSEQAAHDAMRAFYEGTGWRVTGFKTVTVAFDDPRGQYTDAGHRFSQVPVIYPITEEI